MALIRTDIGAFGSSANFGTGAFTTTAFTPATNSLLAVAVFVENTANTAVAANLTLSGGGLTWTRRNIAESLNDGADTVAWYTAPVNGVGASMTLTVDSGSDNIYRYILHAFNYIGHDPVSPVGAKSSGIDATGSSPFTTTLDAAPATTSEVLSAGLADGVGNTITTGTGWSSRFASSPDLGVQTQSRTGSISTSTSFNDLVVGVALAGVAQAAIEIKANLGIFQVGSVLRIEGPNPVTATGSQAITVPAGTTCIVVGLSNSPGVSGRFSSGSYTFTKGGVDTAMGFQAGDNNASAWQGVLCWLGNPDIGAGTFKWNITTPDGTWPLLISVTFWGNVDPTSPARDSDFTNESAGTLPWTLPSLTAQTGDKIVAWAPFFGNVEGTVTTWSNLTELSELARYTGSASDGAWATGDPTGNTIVGITALDQVDDGALIAVVLRTTIVVADTIGPGIVIGSGSSFVGEGAIGAPDAVGPAALTATALTVSSPVIGAPNLINTQAANLATGSPVLGAPNLVNTKAANLTVGSPVLGPATLTIVVPLAATNLAVGSPVLGAPAITQAHVFVGTNLATGSPVIGTPNLVNTKATNLTVGSPVLGTPNVLSPVAAGKTVGSPVLGTPNVLSPVAAGKTVGSPILGTPSLLSPVAAGKTVGSPVLGTPLFTVVGVWVAVPPALGSPVLGPAVLGQKHVLTATNLATGSPVLGTPVFTRQFALATGGLTVASPALGAPLTGQKHVFAASGLATGSPALGTPEVGGMALIVGAPVLGRPLLHFVDHRLRHTRSGPPRTVGKSGRAAIAGRAGKGRGQ
jgi:hypothetical protein